MALHVSGSVLYRSLSLRRILPCAYSDTDGDTLRLLFSWFLMYLDNFMKI